MVIVIDMNADVSAGAPKANTNSQAPYIAPAQDEGRTMLQEALPASTPGPELPGFLVSADAGEFVLRMAVNPPK